MTATGTILVCRCCGEPLRVVCPTHGSEHVDASWPPPRPVTKVEPVTLPAPRVPPAETVARTLRRDATALRDQFCDVLVGGRVLSVTMLAGTLRISKAHVGVIASELTKAGRIERVGRGLYRLVEHAA